MDLRYMESSLKVVSAEGLSLCARKGCTAAHDALSQSRPHLLHDTSLHRPRCSFYLRGMLTHFKRLEREGSVSLPEQELRATRPMSRSVLHIRCDSARVVRYPLRG